MSLEITPYIPEAIADNKSFADCVAAAMADLPSENSRNAYLADIRIYISWVLAIKGKDIPSTRFFQDDPRYVAKDAIASLVEQILLSVDKRRASYLLLAYKGAMLGDKLAESTINRRIAAVKWFYRIAYQRGFIEYTLTSDDVKGYKVKQYRDTSGVSAEEFKQMLLLAKSSLRDTLLLRLLFENALRRGEITKLRVCDFLPQDSKLRIYGKGKGRQDELITLSPKLVELFKQYLSGRNKPDSPLFLAEDRAKVGRSIQALTGDSISKMVSRYARAIGIARRISAHRIRHTSITQSLIANNGNIPKSQKLSRHARPETLLRYLDNLKDDQGEMSNALSGLLDQD